MQVVEEGLHGSERGLELPDRDGHLKPIPRSSRSARGAAVPSPAVRRSVCMPRPETAEGQLGRALLAMLNAGTVGRDSTRVCSRPSRRVAPLRPRLRGAEDLDGGSAHPRVNSCSAVADDSLRQHHFRLSTVRFCEAGRVSFSIRQHRGQPIFDDGLPRMSKPEGAACARIQILFRTGQPRRPTPAGVVEARWDDWALGGGLSKGLGRGGFDACAAKGLFGPRTRQRSANRRRHQAGHERRIPTAALYEQDLESAEQQHPRESSAL